jgi:hypothetical protein
MKLQQLNEMYTHKLITKKVFFFNFVYWFVALRFMATGAPPAARRL